jgi:hypothetical protein
MSHHPQAEEREGEGERERLLLHQSLLALQAHTHALGAEYIPYEVKSAVLVAPVTSLRRFQHFDRNRFTFLSSLSSAAGSAQLISGLHRGKLDWAEFAVRFRNFDHGLSHQRGPLVLVFWALHHEVVNVLDPAGVARSTCA